MSRYCAALVSRRGKFEGSHPCCGVVSDGCRDVSALRAALTEVSGSSATEAGHRLHELGKRG